jgi:hypothetical protein
MVLHVPVWSMVLARHQCVECLTLLTTVSPNCPTVDAILTTLDGAS